jgi:hypothetical protein
MVKYVQKTLEDINNVADTRRGRVSYPILKGFMETGFQVAEVDLAGTGRKAQDLVLLLKPYINNHKLPIKAIVRRSRLYLIRLDKDEEGEAIPDWYEKLQEEKLETVGDVEDITDLIVDRE